MQRTTISASIADDVASGVRQEAERLRRPISWVVEDLLRDGLKRARRNAPQPVKA